ncbi:MAG: hypothetical protein JO043_02290 [Candidatus Eremiobacteraeota bacterium]|nr:hypothetical protein [Candidatus Eremiobacteraeota bacterium]
MHPSETTLSARRALLEKVIDDAGLFPPASLDMKSALQADAGARTSAEAWILGRFVVPVVRVEELVRARDALEVPLPLSVILDGAHVARDLASVLERAANATESIAVAAVELRLAEGRDGDVATSVTRIVADIDASGLDGAAPVYLEFTFGTDWRTHLSATFDAFADAAARSAHPVAAKIRCGGTASVPRPEQLAFAIGTLRALEVPFKATAGLHHPIRRKDPQSGTETHGFLNVLGVAVLDYELDLDERTRQQVLLEENPAAFGLDDDAFRWNGLSVDAAQVAAARRDFVHAFGSCSFTEPIADLQALEVLI